MSSSKPLQESDLIFSSAASSLRTTLADLKRTNLSIQNRLHSIKQDSEFVCRVADAYQLPLIANERCGSWYIPPERKAGSAYFKSTDGHFGQWAFSLRRLNLQVLDIIGRDGGCIIVDSTRRGKIMPDALSKTVPVWVDVMNRLLFPPNTTNLNFRLSVPLYAVSESEYSQISAKLGIFEQQARALGLDLDTLRAKLRGKPMKVTWIKPGEEMPEYPHLNSGRRLIVLCTASNQTSHETSATSDYVQGAADDPESWSLGLDASMFWKHEEMLLSTNEDELPGVINEIVNSANTGQVVGEPVLISPTSNVFIANNATAAVSGASFTTVLSCTTQPDQSLSAELKGSYIVLACPAGKVGSRQLRKELDRLRDKILVGPQDSILVTCETGKDLAVGVALAILCLFYTDNGIHLQTSEPHHDLPLQPAINKAMIKQRLSWIMASMPDASPSRATLQSINSFLMG